MTHKKASCASQSSFCYCGTLQYSALVNRFFLLVNLIFVCLNLTFGYEYTICMAVKGLHRDSQHMCDLKVGLVRHVRVAVDEK